MDANSDKSLRDKSTREVNDLFNVALDLFNNDEYSKAEPLFKRFADEYPEYKDGDTFYWLADILEAKGDLAGAESAYKKALHYFPGWDIYEEGFGYFLWRVGKNREAQEIFAKLLSAMDKSFEDVRYDRIERAAKALSLGITYPEFMVIEDKR